MLESTNSAYRFSLFKNLISEKPDIIIDINDVYNIIKSGFLKNEIENLRKANNQQTFRELKEVSLQAVTISGIFYQRNNNDLVKHSGLIQIDLNNIDIDDHLFKDICNDTFTYLAFKNADGNAINIIIKIKPSINTHSSQFFALKNYYNKHFKFDLNTEDIEVSKAMLLSYDPNIYINPYADIFDTLESSYELKENEKQTKNNNLHIVYSKNEEENKVADIIRQLTAKRIDLLDSDDKKLEIGLSIVNTLGENGRKYYHKLSQITPKYNAKETDTFYSDLIQNNKNHITLATFIHYAKEAGITAFRQYDTSKKISKNKLQDLYRILREKRIEITKKYHLL